MFLIGDANVRVMLSLIDCMYLVVLVVPVSDEKGDVAIRLIEGHCDHVAVIDCESSIATGGALEVDRGEVEEAADLILHLELVRPVPTGGDGAVCALHTILPRVLAMLDAIPSTKQQE